MSKNELEASHVTERAAWRPLMPNKELGPPMPNKELEASHVTERAAWRPPMPNKELHGFLPCQRKSWGPPVLHNGNE